MLDNEKSLNVGALLQLHFTANHCRAAIAKHADVEQQKPFYAQRQASPSDSFAGVCTTVVPELYLIELVGEYRLSLLILQIIMRKTIILNLLICSDQLFNIFNDLIYLIVIIKLDRPPSVAHLWQRTQVAERRARGKDL